MQQKSKKLKIVFFTTDFPPTVGGISEFSRSMAYHMPESPEVERVQVVALKHERQGAEEQNGKLSIVRREGKSFLSLVSNVFIYSFRFRSYDVFHATSLFPIGFLSVLIGKFIFRKPVFVTFYGTDALSTLGSRKTKWIKVWTLRHATKAIAFSYSTRDETARRHHIPLEQFAMVYYPLPDAPPVISPDATRALRKKYSLKQDDFIVLYMGHLVRRKGGEDLIRAIAQIKDPRVKLIMVSDGPEKQNFFDLAQGLHIEDRVIFAGKVPDAFPFYSVAHIFSMPSFFDTEDGDIEGLGIVYLEAQQYGIPVLGTTSGGIPETLQKDKSGFLVPERDVPTIVEKITLLQSDRELRKRMGAHGKEFVREKFNWRKSIRGHIDLYRSFFS